MIPLAPNHAPLGALGYALAGEELLSQMATKKLAAVIVASGSGSTHGGLLTGLRALGCKTKVYGICVRRSAALQKTRIFERAVEVATMIDHPDTIQADDVLVSDSVLEPGYGRLNPATRQAISTCGLHEGILLDPTYSGKAMAGMFDLIEQDLFNAGDHVVFLHTGGAPGAFGYPELFDLNLS